MMPRNGLVVLNCHVQPEIKLLLKELSKSRRQAMRIVVEDAIAAEALKDGISAKKGAKR